MTEHELKTLPLFADLSRRELRAIARQADRVDVREGKRLTAEGHSAHEFFVIADGRAEVLRDGRHVADLGPGDFLGEMGSLERGRRYASVIAKSAMTLVVMTDRDFRRMSERTPTLAARIHSAVKLRMPQLAAA